MQNEKPDAPRPTDLAETLGISVAYASQLLSGVRIPSIPLAIRFFDKSGVKLGPLADADIDQIATLRKFAA